MTQCQTIARALLNNRWKTEWSAKDFQSGENFVGYEATARISDLVRMYPNSLIIGKQGRYRTIALNEENADGIKDLENYIKEDEDDSI